MMKALKMLYFYWQIIGLCPFNFTKDELIRFSYSRAFYSIILSICYTISYIVAMSQRDSFVKPSETLMSMIADIVTKTSQFTMIITTWLYFGLRQKHLRRIQIFFNTAIETFEMQKRVRITTNLLKNVPVKSAIINCAFTTTLIVGQMARNAMSTKEKFGLPFSFGRIVYPNFTIMFFCAMAGIHNQFRSLNIHIQEFSRSNTICKLRCPKSSNKRRQVINNFPLLIWSLPNIKLISTYTILGLSQALKQILYVHASNCTRNLWTWRCLQYNFGHRLFIWQ